MNVPSAFFRNVVGGAILIGLSAPVSATSITIGSIHDATIFQNNPNNSNGAGPALFAGENGAGSPRRGLLEFDIAGFVPAGSTINAVQLTLFLAQVAGSGAGPGDPTPRIIELHRLTDNWGEGVTGLGSTVGGSGQGFAAAIGDATWNQRFCGGGPPCTGVGGTSWATAGGDFVAAASQSSLVGNVVNTPFLWLTNAALVSDVQGWLDAPGTNFGWALEGDETAATDFRAFFTRDFSAAADADGSLVPQLRIDFTAPAATTVPEPGTLGLIGAGLLWRAKRWQRRHPQA
jgi:hypothetical protein